ncbi:MAG: ATP synthase F0 subunit C [Clostridia bacterium]|nr:ATP synthase F0 subunit C [Clostridia bacterium]MBQ8794884.1 ATP synthase F0 subunit C [Clostridia bacterium]
MKTIKLIAMIFAVVLTLSIAGVFTLSVSAQPETEAAQITQADTGEENAEGESSVKSAKAIGAAIAVGLACAAGALGMAMAISKSAESMARQPEISDKINSTMMLGLVFIETAIIYALIVAILVIFVL